MIKDKGKISVRQMMLLFIVTVYTPSVRFLPGYTARVAKSVAWLCPLVTLVPYVLLIYLLQKLFDKYKDQSYMEIMYDILSKPIGKIIVIFYLFRITTLNALYVRYYSERLVTSAFAHVKINIFVIVMLILVAIIIRSGIVVIARMNEIIFAIISIIFFALVIFMLPNVDINKLLPISTMDFLPVMKGSLGPTAIIYLTFLLFFCHEVSNKENFFKEGVKVGVFLVIATTLLIVCSIGTIGISIIKRSSLPFLITIKQITVLDVLTGFESILLSTWIISDFILIIIFTYSALHMIKSIFNLSNYKSIINIYLLLVYFLTFHIANNVFELQAYSSDYSAYANILFLVIIPIVIFIIGKIRKKV